MSRSQFQSRIFILRHAWLNLWDERMTTGRINQVTTFISPSSKMNTGATSNRLVKIFIIELNKRVHKCTKATRPPFVVGNRAPFAELSITQPNQNAHNQINGSKHTDKGSRQSPHNIAQMNVLLYWTESKLTPFQIFSWPHLLKHKTHCTAANRTRVSQSAT